MPRLPQFDRDQALTSAMEVFWAHGYEASSIQKLLKAMQINRGSLYASFGDKASLFCAAVENYSSAVNRMVSRTLLFESDPVTAIRRFFYEALIYDEVLASPHGCLFFNTISELADTDPELVKESRAQVEKIRELLFSRLTEVQQLGKISAETEVATQADLLVALIAGLRLQSKMGADADALKAMIDRGLGALDL